MWVCAFVYEYPQNPKDGLGPLELESQVVVSHLKCVLAIKLRSSERQQALLANSLAPSDRSLLSGTCENWKSIYEAVVHLFFVDFLGPVCDSVFSMKVVTISELQRFWFAACFNILNPLLIIFYSCFSLVLPFYFAYGFFLVSYNHHYPIEGFCFLFSS